jgi:uncharacterized membrane protein YciS (DUF1049 family)
MERLKSPKFIAYLLVVVLAVIVFAQNRQPVTLAVLGIATVQTTLAVALCTTFLVGLVTGALVWSHWRSKRAARNEPDVLS